MFHCASCDAFTAKTYSAIIEHTNCVHKRGIEPWNCCGRVFFREDKYIRHLRSYRHNGIRVERKGKKNSPYQHSASFRYVAYGCEYCGYITHDKTRYYHHCSTREHKVNSPSHLHTTVFKYNCEDCNYKTNKSSDYKRHCNSGKHSINSEANDLFKYRCECCKYKTNNSQDYRRHCETLKHKMLSKKMLS